MAQSHYSGSTKHYGDRYANKSVKKCENEQGDVFCTNCGKSDFLRYVGEHVQYGFYLNKYMEFVQCEGCGYRFCIVVLHKDTVYHG